MAKLTAKPRDSMSSTLFGMPQQAAKSRAQPKSAQKTNAKPYKAAAKKG